MDNSTPKVGKRDTGFKALQRESQFNFLKWGQYMKRANLAERKVEKLKSLLLLTDPVVSHVSMNEVTAKQWNEFLNEFPDEREKLEPGVENENN